MAQHTGALEYKMNSLDILTFKKTLEDYIAAQNMPKMVISMVLKEISQKAESDALTEALNEAKEREDGLQA